jgi:hypothetical protein
MQKAGLEQKTEAGQEAAISLARLEHFIELVQEKLSTPGFETKRMVPEMLDVKVGIDGHNVEVIGGSPISGYVIATRQTGLWGHNNIEVLPFSVRV